MRNQHIKRNESFARSFVFLLLLIIILFHVPIAFAGKMSKVHIPVKKLVVPSQYLNNSILRDKTIDENSIGDVFKNMGLKELGLSQQAFNYAIKGLNILIYNGRLVNSNIITIVDFSKPSSEKRLFVIDLEQQQVLFCTYVAHGINSGKIYAKQFSNLSSSNKSSLGFYETMNTYFGGNGYSLKLKGLEKGINDNADRRAIVIHGAPYVTELLIKEQGYLGRSRGCPALPEKLHKSIIDKIKNGTCLFIYSADNHYLNKSKIINA